MIHRQRYEKFVNAYHLGISSDSQKLLMVGRSCRGSPMHTTCWNIGVKSRLSSEALDTRTWTDRTRLLSTCASRTCPASSTIITRGSKAYNEGQVSIRAYLHSDLHIPEAERSTSPPLLQQCTSARVQAIASCTLTICSASNKLCTAQYFDARLKDLMLSTFRHVERRFITHRIVQIT